jgi:hypothetical protein
MRFLQVPHRSRLVTLVSSKLINALTLWQLNNLSSKASTSENEFLTSPVFAPYTTSIMPSMTTMVFRMCAFIHDVEELRTIQSFNAKSGRNGVHYRCIVRS